jgi:hypothetical protein
MRRAYFIFRACASALQLDSELRSYALVWQSKVFADGHMDQSRSSEASRRVTLTDSLPICTQSAKTKSNMTRETVRFGRNIELVVSLGIQESGEASKQPLLILGCKLVLPNLGNVYERS